MHVVAASNITVTTTTETVLATVPAFNENEAGDFAQGVSFFGGLNVTPGAGSTQATVRVRRGTTVSGTLVGVAHGVGVTAAVPAELPIHELDPVFMQSGAQYVVTIQMTGATANSTVNRAVFAVQTATGFE